MDFFTRFAEFSAGELPTKVHESLIIEFQSKRLIGHISRDSTAIDAREKAKKRPQEPDIEKKNANEAVLQKVRSVSL